MTIVSQARAVPGPRYLAQVYHERTIMVGRQVATPITGQKKYYVYELAYPESMGGAVFYIGKGCARNAGKGMRDRIDDHEKQARRPLSQTKDYGRNVETCKVIQDIWAHGEEVAKRKVYETGIEQDAYIYEWALIHMVYGHDNLTNKPNAGNFGSSQVIANQVRQATIAASKHPEVGVGDDKEMSPEEVAEMLRIHVRTVKILAGQGEVAGVSRGQPVAFQTKRHRQIY
jgi:hypothetical protein